MTNERLRKFTFTGGPPAVVERTLHVFTFRDTFFAAHLLDDPPRYVLRDDCGGEMPLDSLDLEVIRKTCQRRLGDLDRWARELGESG